jgi:hypothetical protein
MAHARADLLCHRYGPGDIVRGHVQADRVAGGAAASARVFWSGSLDGVPLQSVVVDDTLDAAGRALFAYSLPGAVGGSPWLRDKIHTCMSPKCAQAYARPVLHRIGPDSSQCITSILFMLACSIRENLKRPGDPCACARFCAHICCITCATSRTQGLFIVCLRILPST